MAYNQEDINQLQQINLGQTTKYNPLLPENVLPFLNKALKTTNKVPISAINELLQRINTNDNSLINFMDELLPIIGDWRANPNLEDRLHEIAPTILEAVIKIYNEGNVQEYIAGSGGIQAFQVVYITDNNTVMCANCTNETHANRVVGIAVTNANEGEIVKVKSNGKILNPSWDGIFHVSELVWIGNGGDITNNPSNTIGFIQQVGVFDSDDGSLVINFDDPILL